jgi:hypothetical protein
VLRRALEKDGRCTLSAAFIEARPHLFSNTPVFLSEVRSQRCCGSSDREAATALTGYRDAVLSWAPDIARHDPGPLGSSRYDFHLTADGPKLIEVNTNAGGAFLNALLARAQHTCCVEVDTALGKSAVNEFEPAVLRMFENEWRLQRKAGMPRQVAIVDDRPQEQYLYPEFLLAQRFFVKRGIDACVADAAQLRYEGGQLVVDGKPVDLVYNRLVDFALQRPEHAALRAAYLDDAVVVTPNPRVHALFADKRNMTVLSDQTAVRSWGLAPEALAALEGFRARCRGRPKTRTPWETRKRLFFAGRRSWRQGDLSRRQGDEGCLSANHSRQLCRAGIRGAGRRVIRLMAFSRPARQTFACTSTTAGFCSRPPGSIRDKPPISGRPAADSRRFSHSEGSRQRARKASQST